MWLLFAAILVVLVIGGVYLLNRQTAILRKPMQLAESSEPTYQLPQNYGKDYIVLMVKDPYWLHAYWEITSTKQEEVLETFGSDSWHATQPVLRVYDVTNQDDFNPVNAPFYDIPVNDWAQNWYVKVGLPRHSFYVDLGRILPDGRFTLLARSNMVTMPSDSVSPVIDPQWPPLEAVWQTLHPPTGSSPYGLSSAELVEKGLVR